MNEIQLLYVKNIITRKKKRRQQTLSFFLRVANLHPDKQIDILWAGEDGFWHTLAAQYHSSLSNNSEYWHAHATLNASADQSLPGNIRFALRYQTLGQTFWDNKQGQDYLSQADSGIKTHPSRQLQNIGFTDTLQHHQHQLTVTISVSHALQADTVTLHWTTDNWQHSQQTPCHTSRDYWDEHDHSNARNPNHYGSEIWLGHIQLDDAYRVQYSIACTSNGQVLWDNNECDNYSASHAQLKVMVLNLHCYQEDQQDAKFTTIARAINEQDADIICLQEVAEFWNDGYGDWPSNSANIINSRLVQPYHLYTDWSHIGFDKYREGVAILSRYPLLNTQARYVSENQSPYSIHSRKVVMAQIQAPGMGLINIFSAHLSWWEDGFAEQFQTLSRWAASMADYAPSTLLCGDFNITAGSEGYQLIVQGHEYDDQFLAANAEGVFEKIFRVNDAHWQHHLADDYRIDYIFKNKTSPLHVQSAQVLFTEADYGRVSDHCGYLLCFAAP
ncbi:MAG: endonuclease [Methylococcaceae bacterium]|nr:endonuclease [Methylococcaceae bacterium]